MLSRLLFNVTVSCLAMFILGIFLASFFADYLKIVVVRPRPYFLTVYGTNCPSAYNGNFKHLFGYLSIKASHEINVISGIVLNM